MSSTWTGMLTMSGHAPVTNRSHSTNRMFGQESYFVKHDIHQRKVQQRSPVHSYGVFKPNTGIACPTLAEDEVWVVDLAPISIGSSLDPNPGPTDGAYTVNPSAAAVGDGRRAARSIEGAVAQQKAKERLGGSFSRERKFAQHASLADESQLVSSTSSPFEAERVGQVVYYMWNEATPGPGTYDPSPLGSLQLPSQDEVETMSKARKAKLGLPKEQWEEPSPYEPPRALKSLTTGSRAERFTFGAASGLHRHDLAQPAPTMVTGRFESEKLPVSSLVRAGWGGQAASNFVALPTAEGLPRHSGTTRRGTGGMGGLATREIRQGGAVGPSASASCRVDFPEQQRIPGLFHGFETFRRTSHRGGGTGVVRGGVTQHSFSSGAKDSDGLDNRGSGSGTYREHHLKVCHLSKAGPKFSFLQAKQRERAADKLWGAKTRLADSDETSDLPAVLAAAFGRMESERESGGGGRAKGVGVMPAHLKPKGTFGTEPRLTVLEGTQRNRGAHGMFGDSSLMAGVEAFDLTSSDSFAKRLCFNATANGSPPNCMSQAQRQPDLPAAVDKKMTKKKKKKKKSAPPSVGDEEAGAGEEEEEEEEAPPDASAVSERAARLRKAELKKLGKTRNREVATQAAVALGHLDAVDRTLAALLKAEAEAGGEGSGWLPSLYTSTAPTAADTAHADVDGSGDFSTAVVVPAGATFKAFTSTLNATPHMAVAEKGTLASPAATRAGEKREGRPASGAAPKSMQEKHAVAAAANKKKAARELASGSVHQKLVAVVVPPPALPPRILPPSMAAKQQLQSQPFSFLARTQLAGSMSEYSADSSSVASGGSSNPGAATTLLDTLQVLPREKKTAPPKRAEITKNNENEGGHENED